MIEPKSCPTCNKALWGVEYSYDSPERYDGVSEWACPDGHYHVGRWTGNVLKEGELEPRYGDALGSEINALYKKLDSGKYDTADMTRLDKLLAKQKEARDAA